MMHRRTFVSAALGLGSAAPAPARALQWHERALVGLGTTLQLRAAAADAEPAGRALDAAVAAIRAVEAALSLYDPGSELSRLNREGALRQPGPLLRQVLAVSRRLAAASGGAFDITVQPLWQLWTEARARGGMPDADALAAARRRLGWRGVQLGAHGVRLARPGMALTLNGIGQGWAADAALAALRRHGVEHALVDAGEFAAWGRNAHGQPWTLGIEDPRDTRRVLAALRCSGRCLATSADHRSAFTPDLRHHHIFDPSTGDSPPELSSVSVLAPSATLADALTKVMFVAGPARIPALARQWGVGVLWVDKRGRWRATPDLPLA